MQLQEFSAEQKQATEIFETENIPFYIPIYQRRYNWTCENEVQQLLDDLKNFQKYEQDTKEASYYLGNIIVKGEWNKESLEKYILIDGQQRLTTLLLFIKAMKSKLEDLSKGNNIEKLDEKIKLLENIIYLTRIGIQGGEPVLKLDNPESSQILHEIFRLSNNEKIKDKEILNSNYYKNYSYIKNELKINNIDDWNKWFETLERIKLVKVLLGDKDKEISVFESINSKGLPLNALDLIRNYLFLVAENSNINESNKKRINLILTDKLEPKFTKVSTGEKEENKINKFFSAHIAKETLQDNIKEKNILYKAYKKMIETNVTLDTFNTNLDKLKRDVETYLEFITLGKVFIKESIMQGHSKSFLAESKLELYLPLFLIMEEMKFNDKLHEEEYDKIISLLDMHNLALAIADKNNSDNRFIFKYIESVNGVVSYDSLLKYLTVNPNNKSRLTTIKEFKEGFSSTKIYEKNTKIAKYLLYRIENNLRYGSGEGIEFKYSLEHIFPQTDTNWKDNFENDDYKDKFIHTIGNLTLVKNRLNSKLSNQSWSKKKIQLTESSLKLNELINSEENWNVFENDNNIENRSKWLLEKAKEIWPVHLMENVVISESNLDEDEILVLASKVEKLTIVEAIKIVAFRKYPEYLTLEEIKNDLIELYDYLEESNFEIKITFSREKISTGGWMTERLSSNQIGKIEKSSRYENPIFKRSEEKNIWTIGEDIFEKMRNS